MRKSAYIFLMVIAVSCSEDTGLRVVEDRYPDGSLRERYKVDENGKIQGESLAYFEDGETICKEEFYKDSLKDGVSRSYFRDGETKDVLEYNKGILVNTATYNYSNGEPRLKEVRNSVGKLMYKHLFDNDGELEKTIAYYVPGEKPVAWQTYIYSRVNDSESNYLTVQYIDWTKARLVPHAPNLDRTDSVLVHVLKDMSFLSDKGKIEPVRTVKYRKPDDIVFDVLDEDYLGGYHVNLLVVTYATSDEGGDVRYFPIVGNKSRRLPKHNVFPLN